VNPGKQANPHRIAPTARAAEGNARQTKFRPVEPLGLENSNTQLI
jgi:hypothetical protein